jgi:hypothetical protein
MKSFFNQSTPTASVASAISKIVLKAMFYLRKQILYAG